jgi:hypothetical protein
MIYTVAALINSGEGRFWKYEEGTDKLTHEVTIRIKADDIDAALNRAFEIGNRIGYDYEDNRWPSYVRSLSTGDVLLVDANGSTSFYTIESIGFGITDAYQVMLSLLYGKEKVERA